jgi:histidinol-phosphatase (PHP family)
MEINTSPLRKGFSEPYPSKNIIDLYIKKGRAHFTIGSDAHCTRDIGSNFDKINTKDELPFCYYKKRQRIYFS